jgi:isopentenyldiphosphate isomerase
MTEHILTTEKDSKEEMLDILDREGRVLGQASRYECHNNPEYLHPVVHFTLIDMFSRSLLFSKRASTSTKLYDSGRNMFFGEHVKAGESLNMALIRALDEELGLRTGSFQDIGKKVFEYDKQSELATFYLVDYRGEELNIDEEEIEEVFWIPLDKVKEFDDNVGSITRDWIERIDWERIH